MQHGAASASEKASSTSGAVSVCSRSDDGRVPMKGLMVESDEAWPTLGQSQEQFVKKKSKNSGNGTPRGDGRSSTERTSRKSRNRGVPLSREDQDKLFHHEKPERLYRERKDRPPEKEKTHQRRHSIQSELKPLQPTKTQKEQGDETPQPAGSTQTPRDTNSRSFQGGRGRGRVAGRGRFGRGRGQHRPSHSFDPSYFAAMPLSAGVPPMYPGVPLMHPMYYPAVPPYPVMPHMAGMMYPPPGPLPAVPMPGFSRQQFVEAAKKQVEYYFSEENLERDVFLRSKMDSDGWIPLQVIMSFNRLRTLTADLNLILEALYSSDIVELSEDLAFLRTKDHERWVLPEEEQKLSHVPSAHVPYVPASVAATDPNRQSQDNVFQFDEEHAEGSGAGSSDEQDAFVDPDLDRLIVVIQGHSTSHSKGAIMDGRTAAAINEGLAHYQKHIQPLSSKNAQEEPSHHFFSSSLPKNSSRMGRRSLDESHYRHSPAVGWILGSSSQPRASNGTTPSEGLHLDLSLPDLDHPGLVHLRDGNFVQVYYNKFYSRCIKDRNAKGFGKSEEMRTLYRFWCYFLRNNFNARMYADFKKFAFEDCEEGERYGIECLFNFFCYGLEQSFNEELYTDFEDITLGDYNGGSLYGLEKFWAFHHYGGIPQESDVHVNPRLAELIEQYPTLDALRRKKDTSKSMSKEFHHCTSPSSTLSSAAEQLAMDHHMSSVPEAENVISVQNESLSVA